MGSIQRRAKYEKMHKLYGEKYNISGKEVAGIRSRHLTGKLTREEIIKRYEERISSLLSTIEREHKHLSESQRALEFLTNCTAEEFKHLTDRNPKKIK